MNNDYSGKTILVSLAHPDDESFGMGGTLAYYASHGAAVHLICATRGEVGDVAEEFMNDYATKAEAREAELHCAAEHLGLSGVYFLDYRDSGMEGTDDNDNPACLWAAPLDEVAVKVLKYMRELEPDIVLTFDPAGGYLHPDHIKIHRATVRAFEVSNTLEFAEAGAPYQPEKLYYHVFPRGFVRLVVRSLKLFGRDVTKFGRNKDIDLERLANIESYPMHISIKYDAAALEKKDEASVCHASQLDFGQQSPSLLRLMRRVLGTVDHFTQAYPEVPEKYRAKDLL